MITSFKLDFLFFSCTTAVVLLAGGLRSFELSELKYFGKSVNIQRTVFGCKLSL